MLLSLKAGLSPQESIRTATVNAARLLRQADHLGALDEGKHADIIGMCENPLDDITALTRVALVIKAGEVARDERGA